VALDAASCVRPDDAMGGTRHKRDEIDPKLTALVYAAARAPDVFGLDICSTGGVRSRMRTRLSGDSTLETAAIRCFPLSLVKTGNSNPKDFGFRACYP